MQGALLRPLPRQLGLGDIIRDLESLSSLASAAGSPGGISGWMQQQITQFNALPAVVSNIQGIINTLNGALTAAGLIPANVPGFVQAQTDLSNIMAQFPQTQSQLGTLGIILYPALASGSFGLATITQLASNGGDVASTFNGMNQLFAYRDDARSQLMAVAANPALPVSVQQQVTAALNNLGTLQAPQSGIGTFLLYGVGALVVYKIVRLVL
jgi:hypothetical protein